MLGHVKNTSDKGYGFVVGEDQQDYFFHRNDFRGDWEELRHDAKTTKVHVEFDPDRKNAKGPRANNVERLDERE